MIYLEKILKGKSDMNLEEKYRWAAGKIRKKVKDSSDTISTLANCAAILKESFPGYFWVGFYFLRKDHLALGPFQGPPACEKLVLDKGVCADCANSEKSIVVDDVHEYPGHVACDSRSKSEIVIPLFNKNDKIMAVLDIDSEKFREFKETDAKNLEEIAELLKPLWD